MLCEKHHSRLFCGSLRYRKNNDIHCTANTGTRPFSLPGHLPIRAVTSGVGGALLIVPACGHRGTKPIKDNTIFNGSVATGTLQNNTVAPDRIFLPAITPATP